MALTMHTSLAVHPSDWLKGEIVDPHGVSINRLAAIFHVSRQALSNLFNGRAALSAEMAIRFEKAFGVKADTLMRMQPPLTWLRPGLMPTTSSSMRFCLRPDGIRLLARQYACSS